MNDENLIPFTERTPREHKKLSKKGAKKSNEVQKRKKEEEQQQKSLAEILRNIVFAEVKTKSSKELLKSIKKGDVNAMAKIMELLGENKVTKTESSESFKNLIEAIRNV